MAEMVYDKERRSDKEKMQERLSQQPPQSR
jgi:hypothetical protein